MKISKRKKVSLMHAHMQSAQGLTHSHTYHNKTIYKNLKYLDPQPLQSLAWNNPHTVLHTLFVLFQTPSANDNTVIYNPSAELRQYKNFFSPFCNCEIS